MVFHTPFLIVLWDFKLCAYKTDFCQTNIFVCFQPETWLLYIFKLPEDLKWVETMGTWLWVHALFQVWGGASVGAISPQGTEIQNTQMSVDQKERTKKGRNRKNIERRHRPQRERCTGDTRWCYKRKSSRIKGQGWLQSGISPQVNMRKCKSVQK